MSQCHSNTEINGLTRVVQVHLLDSELMATVKDMSVSGTLSRQNSEQGAYTYSLFQTKRKETIKGHGP